MLVARSVALLTNLTNFGSKCVTESWFGRIVDIFRIGLVVLGLVAIATATPLFLAVSLAGDMAIQVVEIGRALREGNGLKALIHFSILLIDTLALSAILVGSWKLMIAAASFSTLTMLIVSGIALSKGEKLETVCYLGLAALGLASAVNIGTSVKQLQLSDARWKGNTSKTYGYVTYDPYCNEPHYHLVTINTYYWRVTNDHDYGVVVNGHELAPGQTGEFSTINSLPTITPSGGALATVFSYPSVLAEVADQADLD